MRPASGTTGADLEGTCAVAVRVQAPAPGPAKTRLAPPLPFAEAAAFDAALPADVADERRHRHAPWLKDALHGGTCLSATMAAVAGIAQHRRERQA